MNTINKGDSLTPKTKPIASDINVAILSIKSQVQVCQYSLGDFFKVVNNFELGRGDYKNNGLYQKFIYLYGVVGKNDFYVYMKVALLSSGFTIENILIEEIISHLPDSIPDYKTIAPTIALIFCTSGVSEDMFEDIYNKAYKIKYPNQKN